MASEVRWPLIRALLASGTRRERRSAEAEGSGGAGQVNEWQQEVEKKSSLGRRARVLPGAGERGKDEQRASNEAGKRGSGRRSARDPGVVQRLACREPENDGR